MRDVTGCARLWPAGGLAPQLPERARLVGERPGRVTPGWRPMYTRALAHQASEALRGRGVGVAPAPPAPRARCREGASRAGAGSSLSSLGRSDGRVRGGHLLGQREQMG